MAYLINVDRELAEEEMMYRERFEELLSRQILPLQENEVFAQCIDTGGDYLYYNPKWFVSNYGYIISVAKGVFYRLKPSLKTGGWERHGETRWTNYIKRTYPKWEEDQDKGYEPQYYFYGNSYPKTYGLSNKQLHPIAQKIIAFYFLPDNERQRVLDPQWEIHHKRSFDWNRPSQYNNRADNLQVLLEDDGASASENPERRQHSFVHNVAKDTSPEKMTERLDKALEQNVPLFAFTQSGALEQFVLAGLKTTPDAAVGISMKNDDGSSYMNVYCMGADVKPIEE